MMNLYVLHDIIEQPKVLMYPQNSITVERIALFKYNIMYILIYAYL